MIPTLRKASLARLEAAANRALAFDPATRRALAGLAGKTLAVNITWPRQTLAVAFTATGEVRLAGEPPANADTTLTGSVPALLRLTADSRDRASFVGTGVRVTGEQALLRQLKAILKHLDIDWEEMLALAVGNVPAHLAGKSLRGGLRWSRDARWRARTGLADYCREEARLAPAQAEVEQWLNETARLRDDTERLAARVDRLRRRLDEGDRH